jgi:AraC-like DNA-binding protein
MWIKQGARETVVREGDTLFLRSCDSPLMYCKNSNGNAYYFVSFFYDESIDLMIDTVVRESGAANLFKDMYESHHSGYELSRLKTYTLFMRLIYTLASKTLKADKMYSDTYHIRAAAEYIHLNYNKKITVEELCCISGYSPAHLRRLFLKHYGLSPREYILNKRIERSKEMLTDMPSKSIEEISETLGMCSPSYFCKLFKEKVGMTPLEYKNKYSQ